MATGILACHFLVIGTQDAAGRKYFAQDFGRQILHSTYEELEVWNMLDTKRASLLLGLPCSYLEANLGPPIRRESQEEDIRYVKGIYEF